LFPWLLLFLAPPLPIAIYLLLLGALNRGRHPVLVPGTWDFAGVLFAASGFLLCGGPVLISFLNDRWREAWLFQPSGPQTPDSAGSPFWLVLFFLYFVCILTAAAFLIRRQRRLTAIYNTIPQTVEAALGQVFDRLGLTPLRTGSLYLFVGLGEETAASKENKTESVQPRSHPPVPPGEWASRPAALEVEPFPAMRHVTLRWDPADWWMRKEIENELTQRLMECPAPRHELGAWLIVLGISILGITLTGGCAGVFVQMMAP
jgi:hypothetical protein